MVSRINRFDAAYSVFITAEVICNYVCDKFLALGQREIDANEKYEFIGTMTDEMLSLPNHCVFKLVRQPKERNFIKCTWMLVKITNSEGDVFSSRRVCSQILFTVRSI